MNDATQPLIHLRKVTKVFLTDEIETHALESVDLEIRNGEYVAISGPSGCGKSTLLSILGLLDTPSDGDYELNGQPVANLKMSERARTRNREIGFIFQSFNLIGDLSVYENVELPLTYRGMRPAERKERVTAALEKVEMAHRAKHLPSQLSGGQQQRVGIGRSLAVEPDVWFLDEPFSALDALIRREMQDEFLRLQSTLKKTIVFITHDFDEAIRLADRVAIMRDGVIDQFGTAEDLIMNPATDYVAAFTKDVPRSQFLRVHTLMGPVSADAEGEVEGGVHVASVARQILNSPGPMRVVEDGEVVGSVTATQVADALFGD